MSDKFLLYISQLAFSQFSSISQSTQLASISTMSSQSLTGKVALITGGSKGIGKAIALKYASLGAKVVINYSGDDVAAASVVQEIGVEKSIAIKANVGSVTEIGHLVDETIAMFGKLDILVANAGIMPLNELDKITEAEFDNIFSTNVKGPLFLAQVFMAIFRLKAQD